MVLPLENKDNSNICILNYVDFCFSARKDTVPSFLNLSKFFQDFLRDDAKSSNVFKFTNIEQLKKSDLSSALYTKSFPVGILTGNQTPDQFNELLKEKYFSDSSSFSFIEASDEFASSLSDDQYMSHVLSLVRKSPHLIRAWGNTQCFFWWPECILARFYNFFGIYTHC